MLSFERKRSRIGLFQVEYRAFVLPISRLGVYWPGKSIISFIQLRNSL